jgi:HPt (histidine-containing phosphotransfer) domain-containing protein
VEPHELPILERGRLREIAGDLDSAADALSFAALFLDLLPRRLRTVAAAVEAGRTDDAHVALLSLATSAEMVGAVQLERAARCTDRAVRAVDLPSARASVPDLRRSADAVAQALEDLLAGG